jgi:hypothetical protein
MKDANLLNFRCQLEVILIRVEAMKAANRHRERRGCVDAYGEDAFLAEANNVDEIRKKLSNL